MVTLQSVIPCYGPEILFSESERSLRRKLEAAHFSDKPRGICPYGGSFSTTGRSPFLQCPAFQDFGGETTPIHLRPQETTSSLPLVLFFLKQEVKDEAMGMELAASREV
jgi:hypothetical protein